jgi:VWFA-related protein
LDPHETIEDAMTLLKKKPFAAPLLLASLLAGPVAAQSAPEAPRPAERRFTESTSVVVVEIPVNVIVDGAPVRGLKAEDFRVFDGRKEQSLVGFDVIDLEGVQGQGRQAPIPAPARRRFMLFFDFAFTPRTELTKSIQGARDLVKGLHPTDVVALAAFSRSRGAELLVNFTNDRRQVNAVLDGLGQVLDGRTPRNAQRGGGEGDPLRLVVDRDAAGALDIGALNIAEAALEDVQGGGRGTQILAETIADMQAATEVRLKDRVRSMFKELTNTLGDFAAATSGLDGRRFFVFFTHGFDSTIFEGGGGLQSHGVDQGASSSVKALGNAVDGFRKAGWEIHAVDPAAVPETGNFAAVDMLVSLSRETGGTLYRNFGNLGTAMGEMLERTAVTYLLAFQVENVRQDGDYHPIRIELRDKGRNDLRGAKVLHRAGFYSPKPNDQGIAKAVTTAERILSDAQGGDLEIATQFVPFRGPAGMTRMAGFVSAPGDQLLAGMKGEELNVEIFAYAVGPTGDIDDFMAQQLKLDTTKSREALNAGHFGMFFDLNLKPGDYQLRLLFRQRDTGRQRLQGIPLSVPDFGAGASLGGLTLFDDTGGSLIIREKATTGAVPYPFVVGDKEFLPMVPAEAPVAGGARRLCLFGYGLRGEGVAINANVYDVTGTPVPERLRLVGAAPADADGLERLYLEFDPKGLSPGPYRVEVQLQDGTKKATTDLKVTVIP